MNRSILALMLFSLLVLTGCSGYDDVIPLCTCNSSSDRSQVPFSPDTAYCSSQEAIMDVTFLANGSLSWNCVDVGGSVVINNITNITQSGGSFEYDHHKFNYESDFVSVTAVYNTPYVLGAIASGTAPLIVSTSMHPGIVQFLSSTTASSGYTYYIAGATSLSLNSNYTTSLVFRPYTKLTTTENLTRIKFGFLDTFTTADSVDGVYFNITQLNTSNSTLQVQLISSNNSVRVTNISATTLNNNTWYSAKITINSSTLATGIIYSESGVEVLRLTVSERIPVIADRETSNAVICNVVGGTTAIKLCDIDFISVGYEGSLVR